MKPLFVAAFAGLTAHMIALTAVAESNERVLYSFGNNGGADGSLPYAGLVQIKGQLYGTTVQGGANCVTCGTVFALNRRTGKERVVYSFCDPQTQCADGAQPYGTLVYVKGVFYGTAIAGGNNNCSGGCGTVFSFDPKTRTETVLYSFCKQQDCVDGKSPTDSLISIHGLLYGTTEGGGSNGAGTAFAIDPATGSETVLHSFGAGMDGAYPYAGLLNVNGTLYGTTPAGGSHGDGTVYSLKAKNGVEKVLYSFCSEQNCADGSQPKAGLIGINGILYGTTYYGGANGTFVGGFGTVFSVNPKNSSESVIYSLCGSANCADGSYPHAPLVELNGSLYGTTTAGGANGCCGDGTIFSVDVATRAETVVYSFCSQSDCADGSTPQANLLAIDGKLYGTTTYGGAGGAGTVFVVTP